jgi:hypothetical protein
VAAKGVKAHMDMCFTLTSGCPIPVLQVLAWAKNTFCSRPCPSVYRAFLRGQATCMTGTNFLLNSGKRGNFWNTLLRNNHFGLQKCNNDLRRINELESIVQKLPLCVCVCVCVCVLREEHFRNINLRRVHLSNLVFLIMLYKRWATFCRFVQCHIIASYLTWC